jgi:hypothetical protein
VRGICSKGGCGMGDLSGLCCVLICAANVYSGAVSVALGAILAAVGSECGAVSAAGPFTAPWGLVAVDEGAACVARVCGRVCGICSTGGGRMGDMPGLRCVLIRAVISQCGGVSV